MKKIFTSLSGVFAALPGVSILLSSLGVPDPDDKMLFGGIIEAIGCGVLGLIFLNKTFFLRKSLKAINIWVVLSFFLFLVSIIGYVTIYKLCVIEHQEFSRVFFPLFSSNALSEKINAEGGKLAFIEKWYGDGANKQIQKLASIQMIKTNIVFLLVYQFVFTSLTIGFGMLGVREEKRT